jgi:scyllo-inositol 2-dehydrogenase (NADP+)
MAPINAAILGTGMSLTVFHHPLLVALPDLYKVHTVLERSGKQSCRSIVGEGVKIVSTYEEVLEDKEVDLVVVSTPNPTHWDYVKRALEAGKHGECLECVGPAFQSQGIGDGQKKRMHWSKQSIAAWRE